MPGWLAPWFLPVTLVVVAILAGLAAEAGTVGSVIIFVLLVAMAFGIGIWGRLRYLKEHPPDPELTHKPFWRP